MELIFTKKRKLEIYKIALKLYKLNNGRFVGYMCTAIYLAISIYFDKPPLEISPVFLYENRHKFKEFFKHRPKSKEGSIEITNTFEPRWFCITNTSARVMILTKIIEELSEKTSK